jgi:hypothetical protein
MNKAEARQAVQVVRDLLNPARYFVLVTLEGSNFYISGATGCHRLDINTTSKDRLESHVLGFINNSTRGIRI